MKNWIEVLKKECEKTSQIKVKKILHQPLDGFPSQTMINQVLKGVYPSKKGEAKLKKLVEGAFMNRTVDCPVLTILKINKCMEYQKREFKAINSQRISLYKACQTCKHKEQEDE